MKNKIDYSQRPEEFFYFPGHDDGLKLLSEPDWYWRESTPGRIIGFAQSEYASVNEKISQKLSQTNRSRRFSKVVEFNTLPVLLENVRFAKSSVAVNERWLLSGASGTRLRHHYEWKNENEVPDLSRQIDTAFQNLRRQNTSPLPVTHDDIQSLDFAIEARNTFNYFHFVTETLGQLCMLDDIDFDGPIRIHYPNKEVSAFVPTLINAFFPEYADRIELVRSPYLYDRAISGYNTMHYYFQSHDDIVPNFDHLAQHNWFWGEKGASLHSLKLLEQNAFDTNLRRLRQRALRLARDIDTSHLPKRAWISRSTQGGARDRRMENEGLLTEQLSRMGFQTVYFEHLTPLEQVALMANAEIVMGYHGAGFANMLFAGADTQVIEIGTYQTASLRWGDFWPHAHVSGCNYQCFFADHKCSTPENIPDYAKDGILPVSLSPNGVTEISTYVACLLGEKLPVQTSANHLTRALDRLMHAECVDQVEALLLSDNPKVTSDANLMVRRANALRRMGRLADSFVALYQVWTLDKTRHHALRRMIGLCRDLHLEDRVDDLLALYKTHFPDLYDDLRADLTWYTPGIDNNADDAVA